MGRTRKKKKKKEGSLFHPAAGKAEKKERKGKKEKIKSHPSKYSFQVICKED